ncbi:MAG: hypothetical protein OHK0012_21160 [Synechococcales cyanobacterium]
MKAQFDPPHQESLTQTSLTLLNFGAHWCGLCRMIDPLINRISSEWSGSLEVVHINVDDEFTLAHRYQIKSLPTLVLLENGIEIQRLSHFSNREDMVFQCHQWLDPYLAVLQHLQNLT